MKYKIIVDKQSSNNPSDQRKEYIVDIEELRVKGNVYDSLIITRNEDYVIRRLGLSEYHVLSILEEPIKEPLTDLNIELFEGDNYIYLMDIKGNKFYAEYIVKNEFTDIYVTKSEMTSSINESAEKIELTVNKKLTEYDTTEETNSKIEQMANSITNTVSQKYATKNELSESETEIKQTIDSITNTVSKVETKVETINDTANSAKTTADSNTKKIETTITKLTKVEQTVDGITQSVSSVEEKVETVGSTANNAKTSAENANSKIDNLQVGGRNFLTNTATEKSVNVNKASGYITYDPYSTNNKQTLAQLGLKAGDKVTISFNWKISKNSSLDNVYGNFRLEWLGVNDTSQSAYLGAIKNPAGTFSASNVKGKVTVTIALTATTINAHTVRIRIDNSVLTFAVSNMKLEAGNMATDWTPAPEDVENNLSSNYYTKIEADSQIQQKADSITTSVNKKITEIQVDADNLLLNTALKKDTSNFSLASGVARVTDKLTPNNNYCFKYNISGLTADAWRSANPTTVELNAGEIVTASANVYVPSGVTNSSIRLEIQYFNASNSRISVKMAPFVDLTKTNQWQRTYITDTAPAGTVKANARVWILRNGQCWVGDLKLGRGNTVTSWCPSSKDYLTETEARSLITQTADSINLEVSKKVGNDEIISKINQSAEEVQIDADKISLKRKRNKFNR